jgi:reverse gyrase
MSDVVYTVNKVTKARRMCPVCGGTARREVNMGGYHKEVACTSCLNGVTTIEHLTQVDLTEALTEIGLLPQPLKP